MDSIKDTLIYQPHILYMNIGLLISYIIAA